MPFSNASETAKFLTPRESTISTSSKMETSHWAMDFTSPQLICLVSQSHTTSTLMASQIKINLICKIKVRIMDNTLAKRKFSMNWKTLEI